MTLSEFLTSNHVVSPERISPYCTQSQFELYLNTKFGGRTIYEYCENEVNMQGVTSLTLIFNKYKYDTLQNSTTLKMQSGQTTERTGNRTNTGNSTTAGTTAGEQSNTTTGESTGANTSTTDGNVTNTTNYGRTDSTTAESTTTTGDVTSTDSVYGFDSAEPAPSAKNQRTTGDVTQTQTNTSTAGGTDSVVTADKTTVTNTNSDKSTVAVSTTNSTTNNTTTETTAGEDYSETLTNTYNSPDYIAGIRHAADINLIAIIAQDVVKDITLGVY